MGDQHVARLEPSSNARFIQHLLDDIRAFEIMLAQGLIEDDIIRIGAEQELGVVNEKWRPTKKAGEILANVNDDRFTTELAQFNIEINLDPMELTSDCLSKMEEQLNKQLKKAEEVARSVKSHVVLTGILPTITQKELRYEYISPNPRYGALNDILKEMRGDGFQLHIRGIDELTLKHDSVLFEACNTSFQLHLQIHPADFIASFNWAQAISAPVLAIAANSPLLLGRQLWSETRIALFRQSLDTRNISYALKDQLPRVHFGNKWASGNVIDIFKDTIANYKVLLNTDIPNLSTAELAAGSIPKLRALNLHNGTIYPWNRACYGVGGGKPHVRIENRYIPSGPTAIDEMANFAFWIGLMLGRPTRFDDMSSVMDFEEAHGNFIKAARFGKDAVLHWDGRRIPVEQLVIQELIPIAKEGLKKAGISNADSDKYLEIIVKRTEGSSGAEWLTRNYRNLKKKINKYDALSILTKSMFENQQANIPVHTWSDISILEGYKELAPKAVSHIMSTLLFTVRANDLAHLAVSIMKWKNIHHVPVEDGKGHLVGLLTWTHVKKFLQIEEEDSQLIVEDIMVRDVLTAEPDTRIKEAIRLMKKNEFGCLPVIQDGSLVGLITIKDVLPFDHA